MDKAVTMNKVEQLISKIQALARVTDAYSETETKLSEIEQLAIQIRQQIRKA